MVFVDMVRDADIYICGLCGGDERWGFLESVLIIGNELPGIGDAHVGQGDGDGAAVLRIEAEVQRGEMSAISGERGGRILLTWDEMSPRQRRRFRQGQKK